MAEVVVTADDTARAEQAGLKLPSPFGLGGSLLSNPFTAPLAAADAVGAVLTRLLTPGFWVRIGIGWAGWMLIVFGVILMVMASRVGGQAKKAALTAASVTPPGRVAKAAAVTTAAASAGS